MTQLFANMRADCNFLGQHNVCVTTAAKIAYIEERSVLREERNLSHVIGGEKHEQ